MSRRGVEPTLPFEGAAPPPPQAGLGAACGSNAAYVTRADEVDELLDAGAPLVICVSGGKDSRLAAEQALAYAVARGWRGRVVVVYANLNTPELSVTWFDALDQSRALAERLGEQYGINVEFQVVSRTKGGLMDRIRSRWRANLARFVNLECVTLILPFPTPGMRYCTSEQKLQPVQRWVRLTFGDQPVICVLGIRRDEGTSRKKGRGVAPVVKVYRQKNGKKPALPEGSVDWNPIVEVKTDVVLDWILSATDTPSSYLFGAKRYSCSFCFMCAVADMLAALKDQRNHPAYLALCAMEIESAFSYTGKWLSDLAPELLTEGQRASLGRAKRIAAARARIEARIPKHLLYKNHGGLHGWPQTVPTDEEAELIARVRRAVARLYGIKIKYTTGPEVKARYAELMEIREERQKRSKRRPDVTQAEVPAPSGLFEQREAVAELLAA